MFRICSRLAPTRKITQRALFSTSSNEPKLISKRPFDSYVERVYKFSTDTKLRDRYLNSYGGLRTGKILEDLDSIAGQVAYM